MERQMKLKIHTYISTLFVLLAGCASGMSKTKPHLNEAPPESSTDLCPTKIGTGYFSLLRQRNGGFYSGGGTYEGEWGKFISTHVGSDDVRELPDRLSILHYSLK